MTVSKFRLLSADVLIPAALGGVLHKENAEEVQARIIVEAANAPTPPVADEILRRRGVTIVPDLLANAGGITVSYFEWAQNIQQFRWDLDRFRRELANYMGKAYREVKQVSRMRQVDLRTAAFVLAIEKVARAATSRTHWSNQNELIRPASMNE